MIQRELQWVVSHQSSTLPVYLPEGFPMPPQDWGYEVGLYVDQNQSHSQAKLFSVLHEKKSQNKKTSSSEADATDTLLMVVHGMGEHQGRYWHFPHYLDLNHSGVDKLFLFDLRGHGRSTGARGDIEHFDQLPLDVLSIAQDLKNRLNPKKFILMGHSLGGHIALRSVILNKGVRKIFDGCFFSAPFLQLKMKVNPLKIAAAKVLNKVYGTLALSSEFDSAVLSKDPKVMAAFDQDPLVHGVMTPRFYFTMLEAQQKTLHSDLKDIPKSCFFLPGMDNLVDNEFTGEWIAKQQTQWGQLPLEVKSISTSRHEAMNEIEKEQFFSILANFIKSI